VTTLLLMTVGCMDTLLPALLFETVSNEVSLGHIALDTSTSFYDLSLQYSMEADLEAVYERSQLELELLATNDTPYDALVTLWVLPTEWDGGLIPGDALMGSVVEVEPTPSGAEPGQFAELMFIAAGPPNDVMHLVLTMEGSASIEGTAAVRIRAWYSDAVEDPWLQLDVL
jgi:hypothetical protein